MSNNFSYGISLLVITIALICCTLIWNFSVSKKHRITFDQAEKIFIYLLAFFLILVAIYTTYF